MPKTIIPLEYSHLLGALLSAQVPYMFMLGCGYFFAKVGLLQKEGLVSFAKMNIEIFLPICNAWRMLSSSRVLAAIM